MRLLFLTDGLSPFVLGGMQQHSTMLVKHLAPLVDHVTVMHCGNLNEPPPDDDEVLQVLGNPSNVALFGVMFEDRGKWPGHYLRASDRLSQSFLLKSGDLSQYDAIYAQGLTGSAFLKKHNRVMVNLHGLEMFQKSYSFQEFIEKQLLRPTFQGLIQKAWKNVSLGGNLARLLSNQGAAENSIVTIPNAIESSWISPERRKALTDTNTTSGNPRFVMVGRNEYRKGFHVLQRAMTHVKRPIELHLIGSWPNWNANPHKVVHHGIVSDKKMVFDLLDQCDILVLPSLSEGLPTVVLEAAARGLKIIATNVGAMSDVMEKSDLLTPGDEKMLAKALSEAKGAVVKDLSPFLFEQVAEKTKMELERS